MKAALLAFAATLIVVTARAAAGMGALECASAILRTLRGGRHALRRGARLQDRRLAARHRPLVQELRRNADRNRLTSDPKLHVVFGAGQLDARHA